MDTLINHGIHYILIDRNYFVKNRSHDRLTVQKVPRRIYKASYPCRHFHESSFKEYFLKKGYSLLEEFDALDGESFSYYTKGFFFVRDK